MAVGNGPTSATAAQFARLFQYGDDLWTGCMPSHVDHPRADLPCPPLSLASPPQPRSPVSGKGGPLSFGHCGVMTEGLLVGGPTVSFKMRTVGAGRPRRKTGATPQLMPL